MNVLLVAYFLPDLLGAYASDIVRLGTFSGGYTVYAAGGGSPLVLWTLRAEFWFYVFYPFVLLLVGRQRTIWVAIAGICLAWYLKFTYGHNKAPGLEPFRYTLVYLDQLMYGAVCAYLTESNNARVKAIFSSRTISLWLPLVGILVLSTLSFKGYDWTWYAETSAAAFLTAPMIIHQWAEPLTGDYEPVATIGRISYSIYLLHVMVIEHFFPHAFPAPLEFFLRCGALIGFSLITFRYIELPFIALSKTTRSNWQPKSKTTSDASCRSRLRRLRPLVLRCLLVADLSGLALHVSVADMAIDAGYVDRGAAVAARSAGELLRRQSAAGLPHPPFPDVEGPGAPPFVEGVGWDFRQESLPRQLEARACGFEIDASALPVLAWLKAGIKTRS